MTAENTLFLLILAAFSLGLLHALTVEPADHIMAVSGLEIHYDY